MKMTPRPTEDILREKGWTQVIDDYADITYKHPVHGNDWTEEGALKMASIPDDPAPAPRPTCGTCPHFVRYSRDGAVGSCIVLPTAIEKGDIQSCGQHPDMAEWIRTEWPKVKR